MKALLSGKSFTSLVKALAVDVIVTTLIVFLTIIGFKRYERGIVDVCATQQDSYVKLVIDQINLKDNRTDEEIIENILNTLDSSSNRYWTFSKGREMLYVKDVLETDRYKSVTSDSYYDSESAKIFLESLVLNRVKHAVINLDGKEYIASGALFEYNGNDYRICLLTNVNVLLDNNAFLGAKIELSLLFVIAYSCMFVFPLAFVMAKRRFKKNTDKLDEELLKSETVIGELNDRLSVKDIYNNRLNLFYISALKTFLDKYRGRRAAFPISITAFRYGERETVSNFFGNNAILFGRKDIKFYEGKEHLAVILSVTCSKEQADHLALEVKGDAELITVITSDIPDTLDWAYNKLKEETGITENLSRSFGGRSDSRTEGRFRTLEDDLDSKFMEETNTRLAKLEAELQSIKECDSDTKQTDNKTTSLSPVSDNNGGAVMSRIKWVEKRLFSLADIGYRMDWLEERINRRNKKNEE